MPRGSTPARCAARLLRHGSFLLVSLASCSEPASEAGGRFQGRVGLVPIYPADASIATTVLAIDAVRVRITRPTQSVVLDSTFQFPASADQLSLDLAVQLNARSERLAVRLELSGGGQALFVGEDTVLVTAQGTGGPATPQILLTYVGPGSDLASLILSPRDTTLTLGGQLQFRITGLDANERPVNSFYARWSTADPGVLVTPAGVLTAPTARGQTLLRIRTANGVADSTSVRFAPPATALVIAGGDHQSGAGGAALPAPLVVQVKAADNGGVPGVVVHFAGVNGSTVRDPTVVTDDQGNASTVGTLSLALGAQAFEATAAGLPTVRFAATATAGPVAQLFVVSGAGQAGTVAAALGLPLVVGAVDAQQNPTPNVTIDWTVTSGGGALTSASSVTDASGHAQVGYTLGTTAGANVVSAQAHGASGVPAAIFAATAFPGPPTFLTPDAGIGQTVGVGQTSGPISLIVQDDFGNPVPGTKVAWQLFRGVGNLSASSTNADSRGAGAIRFTAGSLATVNLILASITGLPGSLYFVPIRTAAGPAVNIARYSGDKQAVPGGGVFSLPMVAAITDLFDNPVPAVPVNWGLTPQGSLSATATQTDVAGLTSVVFQSAPVGHTTIVTGFTTFSQVNFIANDSSSAVEVHVVGGDNQTGAAAATLPVALRVRVTDLGTPSPGVTVSFKLLSGSGALSSPTAITDGAGIAAVSLQLGTRAGPNIVQAVEPTNLKSVELGATAIAYLPVFSAPLAGDFSVGSLAAGFHPVLSMLVTDVYGNPVSGAQVTWSDQSGGSEFPATTTTNAQGVASTAFAPATTGRQRVRATVGGTAVFVEFIVTVLP